MPIDWENPASLELLMASTIAAGGVSEKLDYDSIIEYFGHGVTKEALKTKFQKLRRQARDLQTPAQPSAQEPVSLPDNSRGGNAGKKRKRTKPIMIAAGEAEKEREKAIGEGDRKLPNIRPKRLNPGPGPLPIVYDNWMAQLRPLPMQEGAAVIAAREHDEELRVWILDVVDGRGGPEEGSLGVRIAPTPGENTGGNDQNAFLPGVSDPFMGYDGDK